MHESSRFLVLAGALAVAAPGIAHAQNGTYFLVGAGATDFTDSTVKDSFDTGYSWRAALGVGNRKYVGFEAAYVGAMHRGKAAGPDLLLNGAEGILRLQVPLGGKDGVLVEPFAFGGIGWSYVSRRNTAVGGSDNIGTVPVGAGVTLGLGKFLIDARFTYRPTFSDDLVVTPTGKTGVQSWDAGASIGWEF